jgi:hypothetical protein
MNGIFGVDSGELRPILPFRRSIFEHLDRFAQWMEMRAQTTGNGLKNDLQLMLSLCCDGFRIICYYFILAIALRFARVWEDTKLVGETTLTAAAQEQR